MAPPSKGPIHQPRKSCPLCIFHANLGVAGARCQRDIGSFRNAAEIVQQGEGQPSGLQKISAQVAGARGVWGRPPGFSSPEDGDPQQEPHTQTATCRRTCHGDNRA